MNIDEQRLQQFFNELKAKREAFAENYKYFAPQLAPQFNCFDFIDSDENKLSEIIAHLLNPQTTHAQNDLFLRLFFKEIEIKYPDCNQKVTVNCEVVTHSIKNNQRRIDILVNFEKDCFGLAIENKPWAGDQEKQLSDYNEHLDKVYKDKYCLIYLSGNNSDPSENSITETERKGLEQKNHYKKINFSDIVSWLEQCEKESKSDHVKHFLRDFIAYCQKTFLGATNMIDKEMVNRLIKDNIELALTIEKQMLSVKESLLNDFANSLQKNFEDKYKDKGWVCVIEEKFSSLFERYRGIDFYKSGWNKYRLRFHFERTRCAEFIWGIAKKDDKIPDINLDIKKLNKNLNESGKKSDYWPWWCYFQEPYKNWDINAEPWVGIKTGETVTFVMEKITKLIEVAADFIDQVEEAEELLKKFRNDLKSKFTQKYPDWVFEDNEDFYYGTGNNPICFYEKCSQDYDFLIDYTLKDGGGFFWGVKRKDGASVEDEKQESLNQGLSNQGLPERLENSGGWLYCDFPEPYHNWEESIEPWDGIQSGRMVELVMEKIDALIEANN